MKKRWGAILLSLIGLVGACWLFKRDSSFLIEEAFLRASTHQVRADSPGRVSSLFYELGQWVEAGEALFTLNVSQELECQQELQIKIGELHEKLSCCLVQAEAAMQAFLQARTELALGHEDQSEEPLSQLQEQQELAEHYKRQIALEQGAFEKIQKKIEHKKALSSFTGFVVSRARQEGELVEIGDVVYSLCNPRNMWIDATVPEEKIARIQLGQKVKAFLPSEKKNSWLGEVAWIAPTALENGKGVAIRISFSEKHPEFLKPNLQVHLKMHEAAL